MAGPEVAEPFKDYCEICKMLRVFCVCGSYITQMAQTFDRMAAAFDGCGPALEYSKFKHVFVNDPNNSGMCFICRNSAFIQTSFPATEWNPGLAVNGFSPHFWCAGGYR